jgi:hypothetical protein
MIITEGTFTPATEDPYSVSGIINFLAGNYVESFQGMHTRILIDGLDPIDSHDWNGSYEVLEVYEDQFNFWNQWGLNAPDPYGRDVYVEGTAFYTAEIYPVYDWWPSAAGLTYDSVQMHVGLSEYGAGDIGSVELVAEPIDYDGMATTRWIYVPEVGWVEGADYQTEMTLGRTLNLDYWWEMGDEPPSYQQGYMFDVLALQGGEGWQYLGQIDTYGSSTAWENTSLAVPEGLWGTETEVRFVLTDYDPETLPAVYLRNVSTTPAPEPYTVLLFGCGLIGFVGLRRKFKKC